MINFEQCDAKLYNGDDPVITNLNSVNVTVSDQDRALAFYRDALGFEVTMDMGDANFRWLTVAPKNSKTNLVLFKATPSQPEWSTRMGQHTGYVFYSDDIQKTYEELNAKGVEFTAAPKKLDWGGIEGTFSDPDGNLFELVQTPKW